MKRKIAAVITDILGQRVVIGEEELQNHLERHLFLPKETALELIEMILKDSTVVYE